MASGGIVLSLYLHMKDESQIKTINIICHVLTLIKAHYQEFPIEAHPQNNSR